MVQAIALLVSAVGLGILAVRPRAVPAIVAVGLVVGVASAATSAVLVAQGRTGWPATTLLELLALLVPILLLARRAAPQLSVLGSGALDGAAASALNLRFLEDGSPEVVLGALAPGALPAFVAAGAGLYLRGLDARRREAVAAARQRQRLELAHDLHDFVAHDVTAVVVQAQAARTVADDQPEQAVAALERIEAAGQRALGAIDRAVELLREDGAAATPADLAGLVRNFAAAGGPEVRLDAPPRGTGPLPPAVADTLHRVAAEALTNVRRHAPHATRVEVALTVDEDAATLDVTSDGAAAPTPAARGGTGLAALEERVRALGGSFAAGPAPDDTWRVRATLPVAT